MPQPSESAESMSGKDSAVVGSFLSMLPRIVVVVNNTLEKASEGVSKKAGIILWNIYFFGKEDKGKYLEIKDITSVLKHWLAVKPTTANQASTEARKELMAKDLVITREAPKRIYLTEKGERFCLDMMGRFEQQVMKLLNELTEQEQETLMAVLLRTLNNSTNGKGITT